MSEPVPFWDENYTPVEEKELDKILDQEDIDQQKTITKNYKNMKKILVALMLGLVSVFAIGQIQPIQIDKPKIEVIGKYVYHNTETGDYELVIKSSSPDEGVTIFIKLGKTVEDVMFSLKNLNNAINTENAQFNIDGYDFYVSENGKATILNTSKLKNTLGTYKISAYDLTLCILGMIDKYNLPYGNYEIKFASVVSYTSVEVIVTLMEYNVSKKLYLHMPSYDMNNTLNKHLRGKSGEIVTPEHIQTIVKLINDGVLQNDSDANTFLKVVKQQYQIKQ